MRRVSVRGVRVHVPDGEVVLLLEEEEGHRMLAIMIGPREGAAIATAQAGVRPPRPQTHDLALAMLAATGTTLTQVEMVAVRDGIYFAEIVFGDGTRVDARTSDAVALALRAQVPILCAEEILASESVIVTGDAPGPLEDGAGEDELARFRRFLDGVEADDFDERDS
ncbi:bifunctional nuclease family protein [Serinibacter salmoneus]|uniref:BFN domain-containing protein n=1 Tax=Serinibacter salmoneus TaxID=556530 RepID=A0A2A9D1F3_9MICO|nr:bifunctional nuclease family protein [Serinibacter salmoneus]PFG19680.1 hypothetical protein ATL40_1248 [Serinibacter salmoneus]